MNAPLNLEKLRAAISAKKAAQDPNVEEPRRVPQILAPELSGIPASLRELAQWAPWEAVWREQRGKFDKVPRRPRDPTCGLSTRYQWFAFDEAVRGYETLSLIAQGGVGLNMTHLRERVAIDLDHCVEPDGKLQPWAREIVERSGSYAELSPSGTGVRIFVEAALLEDWTNNERGLEVYGGNAPRFVTVTGHKLEGAPDEVQAAPEGFLEWLAATSRRAKPASTEPAQTQLPEFTPPEQLPEIDPGELPDALRAFWCDGEEGQDGSHMLARMTAYLLERHTQEVVLSLLVANQHAMAVALRHRRDDHDRATDYLWQHHVTKLGAKVQRAVDEFDDLGPVEGSENTAPKAAKYEVVPEDIDRQLAAPLWIVKGVLPRAELVLIIGASGAGKSFVALDLACAIERGEDWRGLKTMSLRVVYIAAEGAAGFRNRRAAFCARNGVESIGFGVLAAAPNFLQKEEVGAVIAALKSYGPVDVVVVDTFAQVTPGANENSAEDMGRALGHCRQINRATGATVILVHHLGKDLERGARGWSGLHAAADAVLEVSGGDTRVLKVTKQKDGVDGIAFPFKLSPVMLGRDEDGADIVSCVVEHLRPEDAPKKAREPKGNNERVVWQAVNDLSQLGGGSVEIVAVIDLAVPKLKHDPLKRDRRREYAVDALGTLAGKGWLAIDDKHVRVLE